MAEMPPERAGLRYGSGGAQDWFLTLACVAPGTGKQSLRDDATALKRYDGKRGNGIERAQRQNGMTPAKRYNYKYDCPVIDPCLAATLRCSDQWAGWLPGWVHDG